MEKILIVDDDTTILTNLEHLLSDKYLAYCASTNKKALAILNTQNIQLCLLDVNLNHESGFDLCKTIRKNYMMPIIFITVKDDEESLEQGILSGADDYITKPFSIKELRLRIMAQLRRNTYLLQNKTMITSSYWQLNITEHTFFYKTRHLHMKAMNHDIHSLFCTLYLDISLFWANILLIV